MMEITRPNESLPLLSEQCAVYNIRIETDGFYIQYIHE